MAKSQPVTEKPPKPDRVESDSDDDESDDEDYAPDEKDFQSDGEDLGDSSDDDHTQNGADTTASTSRSGKRRADSSASSPTLKKPKSQQDPTPQEQAEALTKKSRLDALWAEMNTPVSKPPLTTRRLDLSALSGSSSDKATGSGASGNMVTITTTYDFAGETVTVTKDVPEDSKEAKEFAAKNGKAPIGGSSSDSGTSTTVTDTTTATNTTTTKDSILSTAQNLDTTTTSSSTITSSTESTNDPASSIGGLAQALGGGPKITTRPSILDSLATKSKVPVRYIRKKSNLDELAATYGVKKPPKLNTLEKSKLDWKNFVGKEGIEDELKHHNKDGYMEKVAFLQRTDERRDQEYQQLKKKQR